MIHFTISYHHHFLCRRQLFGPLGQGLTSLGFLACKASTVQDLSPPHGPLYIFSIYHHQAKLRRHASVSFRE
ncbi:MAG: hypothetical protein ACPGWR_22955 [Ardenticatenaceae bacterium]